MLASSTKLRLTMQLTNSFTPMNARLFASQIIKAESLANLSFEKTDEATLVKMPWTTRPFAHGKDLQMPIFNFKSGVFTGEVANLDH